MAVIGNTPEINDVKKHFEVLQANGLLQAWEMPYENLLTRLTAAVFFLTPSSTSALSDIWKELEKIPMFTFRENAEKQLSSLDWRVEFNKGFQF